MDIIKNRIFNLLNFEFAGEIAYKEYNGVSVEYDGTNAVIGYSTKTQLSRGYFLLAKEISKKNKPFTIKQNPKFEDLYMMMDLSRGGVMKVDTLKRYIDNMAALGYNKLVLYIEDLYKVDGYPLFGYMRGRYSAEELKSIDDYGYEMGVEIIPGVELLGHLGQFLRWDPTAEIRDDTETLLVGEPKVYEFIEKAITSLKSIFRTNIIDLNMDEPKGLGLGRYLYLNNYKNPKILFNEHLKKCVDICKQYGYEKVIVASDPYFYNPLKEDYAIDTVVTQEVIDSVPDVVLEFWDYYHNDIEFYDINFEKHKLFGKEIIFCGSIWTPQGFVPNFRSTFEMATPGLKSCIKNNIKSVIATLWNDGGWETNYLMAISGMAIFSEYCYRGEDCNEDDICQTSAFLAGMDKKLMDAVSDFHLGYQPLINSGRGIVYCDLLFDTLCIDIDFNRAKDIYENALKVFEEYKNNEFYSYYRTLFSVCELKSDVMSKLREAYSSNNKEYLKLLCSDIIPELRKRYKDFYKEFMSLWERSNKPNALEMYCTRFGGIDYRLENVSQKIEDYLCGKSERIAELEEPIVKGINQKWRFAHEFATTYRQ